LLPISFKSEFLPPNEYERRIRNSSPEQARYLFLVDSELDPKSLAPGLAWLLLDTRRQYLGSTDQTGKRPNIRSHYPALVKEKKQQYAASHDIVGAFVNESYTNLDTNFETDYIGLRDARQSFKYWAVSNDRGISKPTSAELGQKLAAAFGAPSAKLSGDRGYGWVGWRVI
jgi:hypothetical protein